MLISQAGRDYRRDVIRILGVNKTPNTGRLKVLIEAWMPDKRRRDLDNIVKAVFDSMTHAGIWLDDEQIDDFRVIRAGLLKLGRVVVIVTQL